MSSPPDASSSPKPAEPPSSGSASNGPSASQPPKSEGAFSRRFPRLAATVQRFNSSRGGRATYAMWSYRRPILFGFFAVYAGTGYLMLKRDAYLRDFVHPETYLVWKIHDGSIVESRGPPTLGALLNAPAAGEEAPRVLELFEAIRALKWAQRDERVKGIFADFSGLHLPSSVTPNRLGLAQIEELIQAIHEFKLAKREQFGDKARPSIAWADSFDSQGNFLLASAFDEVWLQPSGQVPLTGLGAQIPFFKRALEYFGIKMHAEARREYKSMVSTFSRDESLPPAQAQNEAELLGELNRGLMHAIGVNRFPNADPNETADKLERWAKDGPYTSREATELGLINGQAFKRDIIKRLIDPEHGGIQETKFKSLHHYNRVNDRNLDRQLNKDEILEVGVVYLLGTISNAPGEFSTSSVIKGLKEAAEDDDIKSIVLRIDSGGGDVVASESIWDAVRRVREDYGKPVIASFGNAAASGGYYAASAADAILACENTITGSIGVASLRPTITRAFFDRFNIGIQSFFTGSTASSSLHELDAKQKDKLVRHIDEMYSDFLGKVCEGRDISRDVIESLAGGRVMTGLSAWTRCNPDAEIDQVDVATNASDVLEKATKADVKKIKAVSLTSDWRTRDGTSTGGNNTVFIERIGAKQPEAAPAPVRDEKIADVIRRAEEAIKKAVASSSEPDEAWARASSDGKQQRPGDVESQLAVAAHEAAEASRNGSRKAASSAVRVLEEEAAKKNLGPYGRGLVDSIGGIWDSAYYAMTIAMQKEIEELITKQGLTLEQATERIRPGCEREVGEDGTLSLATDLRLVRFPEEKPFWKKVKELNKKGDEPQLSLVPRSFSATLSVLAEEVAQKAARAALRMMVATAADPSGIAQAFDDRDLAERLRASTASRGRARAEYPFAAYFS